MLLVVAQVLIHERQFVCLTNSIPFLRLLREEVSDLLLLLDEAHLAETGLAVDNFRHLRSRLGARALRIAALFMCFLTSAPATWRLCDRRGGIELDSARYATQDTSLARTLVRLSELGCRLLAT